MLPTLRDHKNWDILYVEFDGYEPSVGVKIGKLKLNWEEYCKAVLFVFLQVSKNGVPVVLQRVLLWLQLHDGYGQYVVTGNPELSSKKTITHSTGEFLLAIDENQQVVFGPYLFDLNEFCLVANGFISGKEEGYRTMPAAVCKLRESITQLFQLQPGEK